MPTACRWDMLNAGTNEAQRSAAIAVAWAEWDVASTVKSLKRSFYVLLLVAMVWQWYGKGHETPNTPRTAEARLPVSICVLLFLWFRTLNHWVNHTFFSSRSSDWSMQLRAATPFLSRNAKQHVCLQLESLPETSHRDCQRIQQSEGSGNRACN